MAPTVKFSVSAKPLKRQFDRPPPRPQSYTTLTEACCLPRHRLRRPRNAQWHFPPAAQRCMLRALTLMGADSRIGNTKINTSDDELLPFVQKMSEIEDALSFNAFCCISGLNNAWKLFFMRHLFQLFLFGWLFVAPCWLLLENYAFWGLLVVPLGSFSLFILTWV